MSPSSQPILTAHRAPAPGFCHPPRQGDAAGRVRAGAQRRDAQSHTLFVRHYRTRGLAPALQAELARSTRDVPDPRDRIQLAVHDWEAELIPALTDNLLRRRKGRIGRSWYTDETHIKLRGRWCYGAISPVPLIAPARVGRREAERGP